eukprot:NODE_487_length_1530_cov_144.267119.p1 GENE.NODE_487_length_1530_cov_144.267119~~NODE_487_length_1530_cov_144.267119.p1  ORF type:complete len:421 (-),score=84.16 NODE_487_length_1530_cov_144.267119:78-1340(-)
MPLHPSQARTSTRRCPWPLFLSGKMPSLVETCIYVVVQLVGGVIAAFAYGLITTQVFSLQPAPGFHWWQAGLAEALYTFMLCFVVLNVAASNFHKEGRDGNRCQYYGLAIGFVIVAGGYGAGHISGACFNPAVALGIDVSGAGGGFGWCFAYVVFELVGAALAAVLFRVCRPDESGVALEDIAGQPPYPLHSRACSEFLGTFMLVLTVGLNVIGGSPAAVFSIAAALMCMIFALGSVSGAHFNPAVTLAVVCRGGNKCSPGDGFVYVLAQLLGGIAAAFTYAIMEHGETFPLGPGKGYAWHSAWVAECVFTFLLAFVVLSVATVETPLSEYFGLAIGSCVTAGGCAIGAVSGGSLNPAVSVGISLSHLLSGNCLAQCGAYIVFELLGGVLAAAVFQALYPAPSDNKCQDVEEVEAEEAEV